MDFFWIDFVCVERMIGIVEKVVDWDLLGYCKGWVKGYFSKSWGFIILGRYNWYMVKLMLMRFFYLCIFIGWMFIDGIMFMELC